MLQDARQRPAGAFREGAQGERLREVQRKRRVRQYLTWPVLLLVAVLGWFYPWLGFLLLGCMAGAVGVALFRGRAWCDWMCPRGAFYDLFVAPVSLKRGIPGVLRATPVRAFMLALIFAVIGVQWYLAWGDAAAMGLALVRVLAVTTVAGIILGLFLHPRAWCHICPMGTLSCWLSGGKEPLFIGQECTACRACTRVCPMQLKPYAYKEEGTMGDNDCLKCGTCVAACPRRALRFERGAKKQAA
ncbi:4Fe-4S binding protein [Desulfovirgula thermocuniculi]|uniref:4Fe-4S binding protein n=1 Tax=Desulfovirgula thermocuniculi TaxID=348842 RepID=UPI00042407E4|nr:4Fe-4S binding protein [Desulfovirgula thermocuniculi]